MNCGPKAWACFFPKYSRHYKMREWSAIFEAYDLWYSCQMSIVYDSKGDIRGFAEDKDCHNKTTLPNIYRLIFVLSKINWRIFSLPCIRWRCNWIQMDLWTEDIRWGTECFEKVVCWYCWPEGQIKNGCSHARQLECWRIQIWGSNAISLFKKSSNFEVISVHQKNNGRMDLQKQQSTQSWWLRGPWW